ncbi:MAG: hypothetical protein J6J31_01320 [Thermoguttaceae bacterium]|nr:hypothetical protein [Thermoguttaceae bacterium]
MVVSYWDSSRTFEPIKIFTPFSELNSILKKAGPASEADSLVHIMYNQVNFNLEKLYEEYPEFKNILGSNGKDRRFEKNIFAKIPLFTIEKINSDDIRVLGVIHNKRQWRYFPVRFVEVTHENLWKFKILIPRSNGSGVLGEVLSSPLVGETSVGYTRTFITVGSFDFKEEAEAALKYVKSKFARTMLSFLKITQDNPIDTWRFVPLQDFTASSDIDWSVSVREVDRQLYAKYGLTQEEIDFIETHVKEME